MIPTPLQWLDFQIPHAQPMLKTVPWCVMFGWLFLWNINFLEVVSFPSHGHHRFNHVPQVSPEKIHAKMSTTLSVSLVSITFPSLIPLPSFAFKCCSDNANSLSSFKGVVIIAKVLEPRDQPVCGPPASVACHVRPGWNATYFPSHFPFISSRPSRHATYQAFTCITSADNSWCLEGFEGQKWWSWREHMLGQKNAVSICFFWLGWQVKGVAIIYDHWFKEKKLDDTYMNKIRIKCWW